MSCCKPCGLQKTYCALTILLQSVPFDGHSVSCKQEAAWEQMRNMLETQIKAQGGYVDPYLAHMQAGGQQPQHPDYAAQAGSQAFHPAVNGAQERHAVSFHTLERA